MEVGEQWEMWQDVMYVIETDRKEEKYRAGKDCVADVYIATNIVH